MRVIVFGQIRDITGQDEIAVDTVADTQQLVDELHSRYPGLAAMPYRMAVDRNIISQNTSLTKESVIALLPPYSGG